MKVAIMQPYFAPYMGYISLIKHSDLFILFDSVQFIRHGWIERNRILKQNDGWLYIKVPLQKFSRESLIRDVIIDNNIQWKEKIIAQLVPYKKKAPYYYKVLTMINEVFEKEFTSIVHLNKELLERIIDYLGFYKELLIYSEMDIKIDEPQKADEWALNICKQIYDNDVVYINPIGGLEFFDREKYKSNNISIYFHKMKINYYDQKTAIFEKELSIIDVMMFNSPEEINNMLDQYELV